MTLPSDFDSAGEEQVKDKEGITMNRSDRSRLVKCRQMIVDDLEVRVVLDFLIQNKILDMECKELICAEVSANSATSIHSARLAVSPVVQ